MTSHGPERRAKTLAKLTEALGVEEAGRALTLGAGPLLRTGEVALLFGVSEHCIRKWSDEGKLPCIRTLGKHRLFPAREVADAVRAMLAASAPVVQGVAG
jgi:excisionase family DNA binding protein